MIIPFNKPYITGNEITYIRDAVEAGHISGNGKYTKLCQSFFEERYGLKKALMTTSCTDALEMCAILLDIGPGDEIIIPSYTFVSTALAFVRQGAKIVFADSRPDHPGIDESKLETLITPRTKAIVPVHYAGVACDMDVIMDIASRYNLFVVEDAAQAVESYYKSKNRQVRSLGSIGHLAAFSFHETKNVQCGEGGLLAINDDRFLKRAEIIWEKGTNRAEFFRGEVNKYGWVDTGSSFLPSEINSAFLWAQLCDIENIQSNRKLIWDYYYEHLVDWAKDNDVGIPELPDYSTNNAHMFYLTFKNYHDRSEIITHLKKKEIHPVFHYLSLHKSNYYCKLYSGSELQYADYYSDSLLRLPFYLDLDKNKIIKITESLKNYKFR